MPDLPPPTPREIPVIAEHLMGGAHSEKPFTQLSTGRPYTRGGTFVANADGHLADGSRVAAHGGNFWRLALVEASARKAA